MIQKKYLWKEKKMFGVNMKVAFQMTHIFCLNLESTYEVTVA
jgi:hypothetical protein